MDDEALDPAASPGRLDVEVEAVAVDVVPRRGGADEGGGEGVVGMAAAALGSAGRLDLSRLCNHPCIIYGMMRDSVRYSEPVWTVDVSNKLLLISHSLGFYTWQWTLVDEL